ncbi:leucine-rich repeat protein [Prevotella stercorea]|uniref:leucine-rich repeat protein n=1 Tax=Leyella stercorea TaxID=363265 RepID=UPI001F47D7D5|nr:leucine-rich repeat protein [Leyella stercorea]MCF2579059.1 leucine-rich repeat protein [Leyella stercorea]
MGIFKKMVDDIAKTVGERLEDVKNEALKNLQETKHDLFNTDDDKSDDENVKIKLGTFEDGVLTIDEGYTSLDDESLDGYEGIRKVVFPSTLIKLSGCVFYEKEKYLEEVDFSKVTLLKEIPDELLSGCDRINEVIIPKGVEIVGDNFAGGKRVRRVFIPNSVEKLGYPIEDGTISELYLYTNKITDLESLSYSVEILYVPAELYTYYAQLLQRTDSEIKLRKMPEDMLDFYGPYEPQTPLPLPEDMSDDEDEEDEEYGEEDTEDVDIEVEEDEDDNEEESQSESIAKPQIVKSSGNLFSDGLEELINSVAENDELTDKMKEIVLRRAVMEGEDPDEVEMVLEARFYEKHH